MMLLDTSLGIPLLAMLMLTSAIDKNKTIYILSLLPYPDPLFNPSLRDGPSISLALDMARDQINNQTELLPDYHIELIHDDSGCEYTTKAYVAFIRNAFYGNNVVGIIGSGCSKSILPLGILTSSEQMGIVTIHGGGNPLLSNRSAYHYALSSQGSNDLFYVTGISLMKASSWTRVGVLIDNIQGEQFSSTNVVRLRDIIASLLTTDTKHFSIDILPTVDKMFVPLGDIIRKGLRVNVLFTPVEITQRVLCLAMRQDMVYDAYQWIVNSNSFDEVAKDVVFTYNQQLYNCSEREMKIVALNQVFFFNLRFSALNETAPSTYSKYSFSEFDSLFRERIEKYNSQSGVINRSNISHSVRSTYFYDTLWAWSVVLDRVTKKNPSLDLTKYEYGNIAFSDLLLEEFYSLDFQGISGRIKFDNNTGFVTRALSVFQVDNGKPNEVAYYDPEEGFILTKQIKFIPDSFPDKIKIVRTEAVAVFIFIALLQLITLVILHILTLKHRRCPSIRASSLKLHQIVYCGCYIFAFLLLLLTAEGLGQFDDTTFKVVCNINWAWLFPISFTLTFGTVAVRTWRLYRIFTHYRKPSRFIGDYYLMTFVLMLLLVDIVVATIWMIADPLRVKYSLYRSLEEVTLFQVRVRQCVNYNYAVFNGIMFGLRVALVVGVLVLTILTRNIKNQSFTTKSLRVLVYLFSIIMLVGFVTYFISLSSNPLSSLAFISIVLTLNFMLLLFIILIFLPPLMPLLREKIYPTLKRLELKKSTNPKEKHVLS